MGTEDHRPNFLDGSCREEAKVPELLTASFIRLVYGHLYLQSLPFRRVTKGQHIDLRTLPDPAFRFRPRGCVGAILWDAHLRRACVSQLASTRKGWWYSNCCATLCCMPTSLLPSQPVLSSPGPRLRPVKTTAQANGIRLENVQGALLDHVAVDFARQPDGRPAWFGECISKDDQTRGVAVVGGSCNGERD